MIDTGFNGYLTLPSATVAALKLTFAGNRRGTLADGSVTILDVYLATVVWHGRKREVLISQTVGMPLVGMSLLEGSKLSMYVVDGATVTIGNSIVRATHGGHQAALATNSSSVPRLPAPHQ